MLIDLISLIHKYKLNITGILHVGASVCEELPCYKKCGLSNNDIYWIEGNEDNITTIKNTLENDIKIYNYLIDEYDNREVNFNISNALMSSSILDFGTHLDHHRGIIMIKKVRKTTKRLDTMINENNIIMQTVNFLNVDIQGTELRAIKSLGTYLQYIDYIMTEINTESVYIDCTIINELDEYLNKSGFIRVETKIYSNCGWGDAFYIRKNILNENEYYNSQEFLNYKTKQRGEDIYFEY